MDYVTFAILVLVVGLLSAMTADIVLDFETIWNGLEDHRGSGRDEKPPTKVVADLSWVQCTEDSEPLPQVDIIALAKSRAKSKPVVQAGARVRELMDSLFTQAQQLVDYSQLTIRQLKAIAKERGLPKYGSMKKVELIAALQSS